MVTDEITEWQNRPLDAFYAILYIDALVVKVRDGGAVDNKAAYLVTGVDADGFKHVLGIWLGAAEGSRFWAGVLAELRNRGIRDVLFVCCDGLGGLPDAIVATWPRATVQTCVIHLIRSSMKYVSWKERKKAAAAMRPIYTALNEAAARTALENLRRDFGKKSPGMVAAWERAWYYSRGFPVRGRATARRDALCAGRCYIASPPSRPRLVTRFRLWRGAGRCSGASGRWPGAAVAGRTSAARRRGGRGRSARRRTAGRDRRAGRSRRSTA